MNIYLIRISITIILLFFLCFSFIQKIGGKQGQKKRTATLYIALILSIPYIAIIAVERGILNINFFYFSLFLPAIFFIIFWRYIFLSSFKCKNCKINKVSFFSFLFSDNNFCEHCFLKNAEIEDINWKKFGNAEKAVLCFIKKDKKILLIIKKRGIGAGKVNAPGGKIEKGENSVDAAIRETQEEVGLTPKNLENMGRVKFVFTDGYFLQGDIWIATDFSGDMVETDEAKPFWVDEDKIPYDEMWEDDIFWLPSVLGGKKIKGFFIFDGDKMLKKKVDIN